MPGGESQDIIRRGFCFDRLRTLVNGNICPTLYKMAEKVASSALSRRGRGRLSGSRISFVCFDNDSRTWQVE